MTEVDQILARISEKTNDIKSISEEVSKKLTEQDATLTRIVEKVDETDASVAVATTASKGSYFGIAALSMGVVASSIVAPIIGPIVVAVPVACYALYKISRRS